MKNRKGFTLVELLISISILGILTIMAIPTLRAFQARNQKTQYMNYGKSLTSAAKLYNDSYSDDLFGNLDYGCQRVSLTELINKKLTKDISLKDITCNNRERDSFVLIWKYNKEYKYEPVVNCENGNGASTYNKGEELAQECFNTTAKPRISVDISGTSKGKGQGSVVIYLKDDYGFTANQKIEYAWGTTKDETGASITGYKEYEYKNNYMKRKDSEVVLKSTSIKIPTTVAENYYLYIKPIKVENIVNERETELQIFGPFKFDTTPPNCPTITAVDASNKEINKNTPGKIDKFNIVFNDEDLQNYDIQVSYNNGTSWTTTSTKDKNITTYTPTGDGQIIIRTKGRDYANNTRSEWCRSDTYIRDTTKPTDPTVKGYIKTSASNVSKKGSLTEHATNTWLNKWIFTAASGSTDTNGVKYYHKVTGATTVSNTQASYTNINNEGTSTVDFRACDDAGNCSAWVPYIAKLDRTAPTCGTATGASTTWTKSNRTIKQACSDSDSKCGKSSYDTEYKDTTKTASVTIRDNAGNTKSCTYNVYVDKTAPTCGTATGASTSWTSDDRTIKQACTDNHSGCVKTSYDTKYTKTTKTGKVTIADNAGNTKDCSYNVYVDKEDPVCTLERVGSYGTDGWYRSDVTVKFKSKSSDVASYDITTSSSASYKGTSELKQTKDTNSQWYYGYVIDEAGKTGNCKIEVKRDTVKPTLTEHSSSDMYTACGPREGYIEKYPPGTDNPANGVRYGSWATGWTVSDERSKIWYLYMRQKWKNVNVSGHNATECYQWKGEDGFKGRDKYDTVGVWIKYSGPTDYIIGVCDQAGNCVNSNTYSTSCTKRTYIANTSDSTGTVNCSDFSKLGA